MHVLCDFCVWWHVQAALNWEGFSFVHMPIWTFEELVTCRIAMHPQMSDALLRNLFDHWGGIP